MPNPDQNPDEYESEWDTYDDADDEEDEEDPLDRCPDCGAGHEQDHEPGCPTLLD